MARLQALRSQAMKPARHLPRLPITQLDGISKGLQRKIREAFAQIDPALMAMVAPNIKTIILGPGMADIFRSRGIEQETSDLHFGLTHLNPRKELAIYLVENDKSKKYVKPVAVHEFGHAIHFLLINHLGPAVYPAYEADIKAIREKIEQKALSVEHEELLTTYLLPRLQPEDPDLLLRPEYSELNVGVDLLSTIKDAGILLNRPLDETEANEVRTMVSLLSGQEAGKIRQYGRYTQLSPTNRLIFEQCIHLPVKKALLKYTEEGLNETIADSIAWLNKRCNYYGSGFCNTAKEPNFMWIYFPNLIRALSNQLGLPIPPEALPSLAQ